ncbi:MAG TPA: hypothetical protein VKR58_07190 [Aquella sp.]|nr:hypothetical protein [Aquella sp.]
MLTVCIYDPFTRQSSFKDFKIGDGKIDGEVLIEHVFWVEADAEELLYIVQHFQNLPQSPQYGNELKTTWYGDHAKFIVGNIKL